MIDDLAKLLERSSSPADLAVVLIAGPLAYLLDAGLDVISFLQPGYVAITLASVSLGVKKAFEIQFGRRGILVRAAALSEHLSAAGAPAGLQDRVESELRLYRGRITTRGQFESALDDSVTEYRGWLRAQVADRSERDSGVPDLPR